MPASLRIAHIDISSYALLDDELGSLQARHGELQALIRRHLPGVTASLLAVPRPSADGRFVDWYSDLAGQPVPLPELPPARRELVRERLQERLGSLRKLAAELPRLARGSEEVARALDNATHYPDEQFVYAVGDEPVLTLWGFVYVERKPGAAAGLATAADQAGSDGAARKRGLAWLWGLLLVLGVAALVGGWYWMQQQREQALEAELRASLETALAAQCRPPDAQAGLIGLAARLDELDPAAEKYAHLRAPLQAELARCRMADDLSERVAAAGWGCAQLATLQTELAARDTSRAPLDTLNEQLLDAVATCSEAADYRARLTAARGDCPLVMELDAELGQPLADALPLVEVRGAIDDEVRLCEASGRFAAELEENIAQCENLQRLDGRMKEFAGGPAALQPVRERLDAELELCRRAHRYREALIGAQMDCDLIRELDREMQGEDSSREPLQSLRAELDGALEQCKALDELEQAFNDAGGDCPKLAQLSAQMQGLYPRNPIFVEVKKRIAAESEVCGLNQALEAQLAAAVGDCDALHELQPAIEAQPADDPRFGPLHQKLAEELALCERAGEWQQRLAAAGGDCPQLNTLEPRLQAEPGVAAPQFEPVRGGLDEALAGCRALVVAQARKQEKVQREQQQQAQQREARRDCPGVREKQQAPQLAMVIDASGSMDETLFPDAAIERQLAAMEQGNMFLQAAARMQRERLKQQFPNWPSRMQVAKRATARIVRELPDDVDIGLVKVADCPGAVNAGFFPPARRGDLLGRIKRLRPEQKTPLASGIAQAANMVDGVNRPAVMVVISDGQDTCGGDPCAMARQAAKKKPKLTINVIDITGTGAANCAATATGGRVFQASNAQELKRQMRRATQQVRGPAECRRQ